MDGRLRGWGRRDYDLMCYPYLQLFHVHFPEFLGGKVRVDARDGLGQVDGVHCSWVCGVCPNPSPRMTPYHRHTLNVVCGYLKREQKYDGRY